MNSPQAKSLDAQLSDSYGKQSEVSGYGEADHSLMTRTILLRIIVVKTYPLLNFPMDVGAFF